MPQCSNISSPKIRLGCGTPALAHPRWCAHLHISPFRSGSGRAWGSLPQRPEPTSWPVWPSSLILLPWGGCKGGVSNRRLRWGWEASVAESGKQTWSVVWGVHMSIGPWRQGLSLGEVVVWEGGPWPHNIRYRIDYRVGDAWKQDFQILDELNIATASPQVQLAIPVNVLNSHVHFEDFVPQVCSE